MNKQNRKVLLEEIEILHKNISYLIYLHDIEKFIGFKLDLIDEEKQSVLGESLKFLKRLKSDFFYDDEMVGKINKVLENSDGLYENMHFICCDINSVIAEFLNYPNTDRHSRMHRELQEKAIRTLWRALYGTNRIDKNKAIKISYLINLHMQHIVYQGGYHSIFRYAVLCQYLDVGRKIQKDKEWEAYFRTLKVYAIPYEDFPYGSNNDSLMTFFVNRFHERVFETVDRNRDVSLPEETFYEDTIIKQKYI